MAKNLQERAFVWIFVILIAASIFARFYYLDYFRFEHEMVRDLEISGGILKGDLYFGGLIGKLSEKDKQQSFGPLYYYLIALSIVLFGFSNYYIPLAPNILIIIMNVISIFLLYFFVRKFFGKYIALVSTGLYSTSVWNVLHISNVFTNPNFLPVFVISFIYFLYNFVIEKNDMHLTYALITLALAMNFHLETLMLVPIVVAAIILRGRFKFRYLFYGGAGMLAVFLPFIISGIADGSLVNVVKFLLMRYPTNFLETFVESIGIPVMIATPYLGKYLLGNTNIFFGMWDSFVILVTLTASVLVIAGFCLIFYKYIVERDKKALILLLWYALPTFFYAISSKNVSPHYFLVLFPSQFVMIGILLDYLRKRARLLNILSVFLLVSNIAILAVFFQGVDANGGTEGIFGVPYKFKYEAVNYIKSQDGNAEINYYRVNKRDFNYIFKINGIDVNPKILNSLEEFKSGYLILDRYSFYSHDGELSEEDINLISKHLVKKIGNFEIYRR